MKLRSVGGTDVLVILRACEEMSLSAALADDDAREGALNNLSPALGAALGAGKKGRAEFRGRGGKLEIQLRH